MESNLEYSQLLHRLLYNMEGMHNPENEIFNNVIMEYPDLNHDVLRNEISNAINAFKQAHANEPLAVHVNELSTIIDNDPNPTNESLAHQVKLLTAKMDILEKYIVHATSGDFKGFANLTQDLL